MSVQLYDHKQIETKIHHLKATCKEETSCSQRKIVNINLL